MDQAQMMQLLASMKNSGEKPDISQMFSLMGSQKPDQLMNFFQAMAKDNKGNVEEKELIEAKKLALNSFSKMCDSISNYLNKEK